MELDSGRLGIELGRIDAWVVAKNGETFPYLTYLPPFWKWWVVAHGFQEQLPLVFF